jgi:beta-glucosidase-like glycosyl hydrolase
MRALSDDIGNNSFLALQAGCDIVMHCNGNFEEISQIANKISSLDLISIDPNLLETFQLKKTLNVEEVIGELAHILTKFS